MRVFGMDPDEYLARYDASQIERHAILLELEAEAREEAYAQAREEARAQAERDRT